MTAIRTPPLAEVIRLALDARLLDLHVALPARVDAYDPVKQSVDVVPLLMGLQVGQDGQAAAVALGKLPNVPVVFPGGGGYRATFPIAQGDTVLLIIADRSLDVWKADGGLVDPKMGAHSLPDAVAIPGLRSFAKPLASAPTDRATFGKDGGPVVETTASGINLGAGASQGVARTGDAVGSATSMAAWIAKVNTALAGTGPANKDPTLVAPTDFGTITGGSASVRSV